MYRPRRVHYNDVMMQAPGAMTEDQMRLMWRVEVPPDEVRVALLKTEKWWGNTKTGTYGEGVDPYAATIGVVGEFGFSKILGYSVCLEYSKYGVRHDFDIPQMGTFDVKTARQPGEFCNVRVIDEKGNKIPFESDYVIGACLARYMYPYQWDEYVTSKNLMALKPVVVWIQGYMSKEEFEQYPIVPARDPRHGWKNREIPFGDMSPMMDMKSFVLPYPEDIIDFENANFVGASG